MQKKAKCREMMASSRTGPKDIDEYIRGFPEDTRMILEKIRQTISEAAPEAQETINYAIPTFQLHGNLVHFAAFKRHIGFYPGPSGIAHFNKELSIYENAKGSVKFPLDEPIPYALIRAMVSFRVQENLAKAAEKKHKKK
jgi:uncharacterized protein YdhG (YjbR/CyaY superfamily)